MERYETVIHVITDGEDDFDAGERAGELVNVSKLKNDMVISCEPTHLISEDAKRYETLFKIISEGEDEFDAGDRAGETIDIARMDNNMVISCEPTRPLETFETFNKLVYC